MALEEELEAQGGWLFRRRSFLPLAALPVGVMALVFMIRTHGIWFACVLPYWHVYEYICLAVGMSGTFLRLYTVGHTPVRTSGRNTSCQVAESLNTTGIYSIVRHPLYLGNFLMWTAVALLTCSVGFVVAFVLAYWLYYERIMYAEERFLRRKFADVYMQWADATPAFVPRWKLFRPASQPFSWRKTIKKEKNGVTAILLLFSMLDGIVAWQTGLSVNLTLLILTGMSVIAYIVLKYIKTCTGILDETGR